MQAHLTSLGGVRVAEMRREGLTFADCLAAVGEMSRPGETGYASAARRLHHREGTLEIDDITVVSRGADDGCYVLAWVWVPDDALTEGEMRTEIAQTRAERGDEQGDE